MRADEVRNMMNRSKAMDYIIQAANQGKSSVEIPRDYVDRTYLEQQGYKISGGESQLSEFCTVSWQLHWRD